MIKNKILSFSLLAVILVLGSSSSITGSSTVGEKYTLSSIGEPDGYSTNVIADVLVLYSDTLTAVDDVIATMTNYTVDKLDVEIANPKLSVLSQYPVVIIFNNYNYLNATETGNVLADYLDTGGKVIQMAHTFSFGWHVEGRFYDANYTVFRGTNTNIARVYDGLSTHTILNGVTTFNTGLSMDVTLTPGSNLIASFTDGQAMMAIKNNVIALNVYPGSNWSGDLGVILENSIKYFAQDRVLMLYSDSVTSVDSVAVIITKYQVDKFDVEIANPTLTQLSDYQVVIVFNNYNYLNATETGNVLADYIDVGGKVVQLAHSFSFGWHITGRFYDANYTVFRGTNTNIARVYDGASTHSILNGVTSFNAGFSMDVTLTPGSELIASFTDKQPMIGIKNSVVAINVYPGSNWSGDLGIILDNSIEYLQFLDTVPPTITGPLEALIEVGDPSSQVAWQITDESPGSFDIYQNGTLILSSAWTDTIFQAGIALASYSPGTYEFRVDARDVHGNEVTFLTIVYVRDTIAPVFTSFSDRHSYVYGDTGNILAWQVTDADPETYVIYQTTTSGAESTVNSGIWFDFEQIVIRIDGLDPGEYIYRAEFTDGSGHTSVVETIVVVEPVPITSEPTGNTSDPTSTSETPTTSDQTSTSESNGDTDSSDTPALPIPFSNIYVIMFSILGLAFIVRKRK